MSFLLPDDDQQATLHDALALIDACERRTKSRSSISSPSTVKHSTSSASETSEMRTTDDEDDDDEIESKRADAGRGASLRVVIRTTANKKLTAAPAVTKADTFTAAKPQQFTAWPSSPPLSKPMVQKAIVAREQERPTPRNGNAVTRHRARKRAEFASLKVELAALEATLARLQLAQLTRGTCQPPQPGSSSRAGALTSPNGSHWMDIAAEQARERHKSEALNQKLKDAVEKQMKVTKALEAILSNNAKRAKNTPPIFFGFDLLSDHQKQGIYNDSLLTPPNMVLAGLRACVEQMYQCIDTVFNPVASARSMDLASQAKQMKTDPVTGDPFVELQSNTLLPCGFFEGGLLLWRVFASKSEQNTPGYVMKKREVTDSSFQKDYSLMIDIPGGGAVELRGVSFVQKCVDEDRVSFMFASSIATMPAGNGPTFREKGWIVFSRSGGDFQSSLFPSVAQTCQHIFSEQSYVQTSTASSSKTSVRDSEWTKKVSQQDLEKDRLRDVILSALVRRTQLQYQSVMNVLLRLVENVQVFQTDAPEFIRTLTPC